MHQRVTLQTGRANPLVTVMVQELTLGTPRAPFLRGGVGTAALREPAALCLSPTTTALDDDLDGGARLEAMPGDQRALGEAAPAMEQEEVLTREGEVLRNNTLEVPHGGILGERQADTGAVGKLHEALGWVVRGYRCRWLVLLFQEVRHTITWQSTPGSDTEENLAGSRL